GDVGRVVDRRVCAGLDPACQVAQRIQEAGRELGGDIVAAAIPEAVVVICRVGAGTYPVAVAGAAADAAVARLEAELERLHEAALGMPGAIELGVILLGAVPGPGRTGRTEVDLQEARGKVLHQFRRERHRRRAGQVPRAGEVAQAPAAVRVLASWLDRHRELQVRATLGPGAARLEGQVQRFPTPLG